MATKSTQSPKRFLFGMAFIIICILLIRGCFSVTNNVAKVEEAKSLPIDKMYDTEWHDAAPGDEYISVAKILSENKIPCGYLKLRNNSEGSGSFLCGCNVDIDEPWRYYLIYPSLDKIEPVSEPITKPTFK